MELPAPRRSEGGPSDDATRKLKAYIRELDNREQEVLQSQEERSVALLQQLSGADEASWRQISDAVQGVMDRKQQAFMQDMHSSAVDYEERLMMQNEKLQVEVRMWELREQDLQEQFAFREQQIKRKYEERIGELEEQLRTLGGVYHPSTPEYSVVHCPVSLGIDIAEERAQLYLTKEPIKMHPGVRVIGVDPAVGSSGVAVGDVITKVSFTVPIGSSADFRNAVTKMAPGDLVMIHVEKEGAERVIPVVAGGIKPGQLD
eukprot:EG_transcript_21759